MKYLRFDDCSFELANWFEHFWLSDATSNNFPIFQETMILAWAISKSFKEASRTPFKKPWRRVLAFFGEDDPLTNGIPHDHICNYYTGRLSRGNNVRDGDLPLCSENYKSYNGCHCCIFLYSHPCWPRIGKNWMMIQDPKNIEIEKNSSGLFLNK